MVNIYWQKIFNGAMHESYYRVSVQWSLTCLSLWIIPSGFSWDPRYGDESALSSQKLRLSASRTSELDRIPSARYASRRLLLFSVTRGETRFTAMIFQLYVLNSVAKRISGAANGTRVNCFNWHKGKLMLQPRSRSKSFIFYLFLSLSWRTEAFPGERFYLARSLRREIKFTQHGKCYRDYRYCNYIHAVAVVGESKTRARLLCGVCFFRGHIENAAFSLAEPQSLSFSLFYTFQIRKLNNGRRGPILCFVSCALFA